ncbi:hypothetical protein D3C72_1890250 [compost metagenome]
MPPPSTSSSEEKSRFLKSGLFISALNSVLRPGKICALWFCSSLTKAGMSRGLAISTLWLPVAMPISEFTVSAKIW